MTGPQFGDRLDIRRLGGPQHPIARSEHLNRRPAVTHEAQPPLKPNREERPMDCVPRPATVVAA
jgi:hypothetical protein